MVAMGAFFSLVVVTRQQLISPIRMPTIPAFAVDKFSLDDLSAKLIRKREGLYKTVRRTERSTAFVIGDHARAPIRSC